MTHQATVNVTETRAIDQSIACCEGGHQPSGHPKVYLKIHPVTGDAVCPYCSRRFVQTVVPTGRSASKT